MKLALCGNPNVGKTTLFNRLTRSDAPVGNWHGVTVEVRTKRFGSHTLSDLPGAYSLTPRTAEERVTRDAVLSGGYDVIVYVAEINALRRDLYLFMQLLEADRRAALVVNMMDEAVRPPDLMLLSKRLGVPVVGTSSRDKDPREALVSAAERALKIKPVAPDYLNDSRVVSLAKRLAPAAVEKGLEPVFAALKVIERDAEITENIGASTPELDRDLPARFRYAYIDKILVGVYDGSGRSERTRKIDRIALGKLALPIFLAVMGLVFVITFEAGRPLSDLLSRLVAFFAERVREANIAGWLSSLLADGVIGGVGSVLAFLPQVVILFLLTAILQDSGYMSRVAFVTDGFFKKVGLSGRAAFSAVLGLGCSATAVLTSRGIAGKSARRRAALATPFFPCSARLAVFTAIAAYFGLSGFTVAAMYVLGFGAALCVLLLMKLFGRGDGESLILEMPPYRVPQAKRIFSLVWRNCTSFVVRVGSVVLAVSVVMWVLCNFSIKSGFSGGVDDSLMRSIAELVAPVFSPLGFGNWKAVAALISGVAAKETVIAVIGSLGGMGEVLGSGESALSFMIFVCLYVPCIATVSALGKECGAKTALVSVGLHFAIAYAASLAYCGALEACEHNPALFWSLLAGAFATIVLSAFVARLLRRKRAGRRKLLT